MTDTPNTTPDPAADATAALASRRRGRKAAAGTIPAPLPGGTPAPVDGAVPSHVVASRTLVSSHLGAGGPPHATGGPFNATRPLIMEPQPASAVALPEDADYVIAECDADEAAVMPGCTTPVSRSLWFKGYRIYRPFYEAVLAAHAVAVGTGDATAAPPAQLPAGRAAVPDTVLVNPVAIAAAATPPAPVAGVELPATAGGAPTTG